MHPPLLLKDGHIFSTKAAPSQPGLLIASILTMASAVLTGFLRRRGLQRKPVCPYSHGQNSLTEYI